MASSNNSYMPSNSAVQCAKFREKCRAAIPDHPFTDAELIHIYNLGEAVFRARKDVLIATKCPAPWDKQILRCEKAYDDTVENCESEPLVERFNSFFKMTPLVERSRILAERAFEKHLAAGRVPEMAIQQLDRNLSCHHPNESSWEEFETELEAEIQAKRAADEQMQA